MNIPIYQVDAFEEGPFTGNPAAVCVLDRWLPAELMQAIAAENNLAETAFAVRDGMDWRLRWFTPTVEVDLCGHATLATAFVLMTEKLTDRDTVVFQTKSGALSVLREAATYTLDFPSIPPQATDESPRKFIEYLGVAPIEIYKIKEVHGTKYRMAVFAEQASIESCKVNVKAMAEDFVNVVVTAPATTVDFVSRFFAVASGIDEDPVTGSTHCSLTPYWAARLGKTELTARQLSKRGGSLRCRMQNDRVLLSGSCRLFLRGEITISV